MTKVTQKTVWEWLQANGPATPKQIAQDMQPGAFCDHCDREFTDRSVKRDVSRCIRRLRRSGHVSLAAGGQYKANDTDALQPVSSPFGSMGRTTTGEEPPDRI